MEQNTLKIDSIQKIFDILYPESGVKVVEIEVLPRNQLNENMQWVEDSPAYFVGVKIKEFPNRSVNMSETLTLFTGFEFNIYRI